MSSEQPKGNFSLQFNNTLNPKRVPKEEAIGGGYQVSCKRWSREANPSDRQIRLVSLFSSFCGTIEKNSYYPVLHVSALSRYRPPLNEISDWQENTEEHMKMLDLVVTLNLLRVNLNRVRRYTRLGLDPLPSSPVASRFQDIRSICRSDSRIGILRCKCATSINNVICVYQIL